MVIKYPGVVETIFSSLHSSTPKKDSAKGLMNIVLQLFQSVSDRNFVFIRYKNDSWPRFDVSVLTKMGNPKKAKTGSTKVLMDTTVFVTSTSTLHIEIKSSSISLRSQLGT